MRPSSTASNSIVALSVSISARMSPDCTVVAFLHQPFGELALLHRGRQRGHEDLRRPLVRSPARASSAACCSQCLPSNSVVMTEVNSSGFEAAEIHAVAVGMRARHVERFDAADRAEQVLRRAGVEGRRCVSLSSPRSSLKSRFLARSDADSRSSRTSSNCSRLSSISPGASTSNVTAPQWQPPFFQVVISLLRHRQRR